MEYNSHKHRESEKDSYRCPECHLRYKEKKWAEECEAWCKEHRTCNLEIIRHAIKNQRQTENIANFKK